MKTYRLSIAALSIALLATVKAFSFTLLGPNIRGYLASPLNVHMDSSCTSDLSNVLNDAIDFWNQAPHSGLVLERGYDVAYASADVVNYNFEESIVVLCSTNFSADANGFDANSVLGVGSTRDTDFDGHIDKGRMIINFTPNAQANFNASDGATQELTVIHELGHVLGLGHSSEPGAIMYFTTNGKGEVNLHQDDIDGLRHLYAQDELGGDYFLGCAHIAGGSGRNQKIPPFTLLFLIVPVLLVFLMRQLSKLES